jgi:general secretion pathway protein G
VGFGQSGHAPMMSNLVRKWEMQHTQNISPEARRVICQSLSILNNRKSAGFSLIELIIVVIIIVILMGFFMNRVMFYQEQAEKVAMEEVVGSVQSALTLQYGQLLTRGKSTDISTLVSDNPMNWMQKRPSNYSGEFYDPTSQSVHTGNWVFDLKHHELVYLINNGTHFKVNSDGQRWIRFHVQAQYQQSRLPSLQNSIPELTGILFEPTQPYAWF